MLTKTADYALRALVYLAHDPEDGYHQTRDLSVALNVPSNYLGKILQLLAHARVVESQRGMNGGFRLARLPEQVRLYDVLGAIDALPAETDCPLVTGGRQMELCTLHRRFAAIASVYVNFLKETTLQDVLDPAAAFPGSCPGPGRMPAQDGYPCPDTRRGTPLTLVTA